MKKEKIKQILPLVFQRTAHPESPLHSILGVMEDLHAPSESVLETLPVMFRPHTTPDAFVPYLASWVDLSALLDMPHVSGSSQSASLSTGVGRLRELTAAAATLSKWRGTGKGLRLFLETATGMTGFQIEETVTGPDGKTIPFHLRITAPGPLQEHRSLVERIIELEKPAYVTHELVFASA